MADSNPLAGMPLAASLTSHMNDTLQWMSRMWGGAAGAGLQGAAPGVPSMMMPTFDPVELEKRIGDLRTVLHWLDMNRALLQSTIQALEMQRDTILAMQSMARSGAAAATGASAVMPGSGGPQTAVDAAAQAFDPSVWWNALQEQFARVAASAVGEAPATPEPSSTASASAPGPAPAPASPKAAAASRKSGGGP